MPLRLGRYAVRRRIGSGGFATVWLAYDEQLDAPVAVKVLADNWSEDFGVRTRFVEEGRYLRRVESPHVVTVYDAGELDDGRPYLVMTYADQGTLADRLQVGGLTVAQSLEIVRQVGSGLQALHDRGILHRDVKPANVLFRTIEAGSGPWAGGGEVRAMVGDLGLGKALDVSSRLTMIAGTPSFVAPEQAQGETPDSQADQYSLGVLTFLLLNGRTPWTHATLGAAAEPGPPPSLSTPDRQFPQAAEDVVRRALARDRDQRWPSVSDYVDALSVALDDWAGPVGQISEQWLPVDPELTVPGARPSPEPARSALAEPDPPQRPRRWRAVVAGVVALALGVAAGWFVVRGLDQSVTVTDERDALSVTVPEDWDAVAAHPWTPPDEDADYSALSAGTTSGWQDGSGQGVFVAILPQSRLPTELPQHPDCETSEDAVTDTRAGDATRTVYWTGCPGITVERVVQVADNRVLWVQVRSDDRTTANDVLDSVEARGFS